VIKFLVNVDPNTTLLEFLREQLHQTGTKEGCATGHCGACTVVVGQFLPLYRLPPHHRRGGKNVFDTRP